MWLVTVFRILLAETRSRSNCTSNLLSVDLPAVMFAFLNPVITAGPELFDLQDSAPLQAAHPNPVQRHWPGADWRGSGTLLNAGPCLLHASVLFPFKFCSDKGLTSLI